MARNPSHVCPPCAALSCRRDCMSFTKSLSRVSARCQICDAQRVPYASAALGLLEAEGHVGAILLGPHNEGICDGLAQLATISRRVRRTLLLLVAIIFGYLGLEELARRVVFGSDEDLRFVLWLHTSAYSRTSGGGHEGSATAGVASCIDVHSRRHPCKSPFRDRTSHCS